MCQLGIDNLISFGGFDCCIFHIDFHCLFLWQHGEFPWKTFSVLLWLRLLPHMLIVVSVFLLFSSSLRFVLFFAVSHRGKLCLSLFIFFSLSSRQASLHEPCLSSVKYQVCHRGFYLDGSRVMQVNCFLPQCKPLFLLFIFFLT